MVHRIMHIAAATPMTRALMEAHRPPGCELLLLDRDDEAERLRMLAEADALIVGTIRATAAHVEAARKLRVVQHQGVGWHDRIPGPALRARGIRLAVCPAGAAESVAEHALMLMIAAQRHAAFADRALRAGRWENAALRPRARLLHGRTVGLIGMGRIGRHLASLLRPFGVTGLYHTPRSRLPPEEEERLNFRHASLDEVLAESDVLSLHLPGTAETRHLIRAETIARMRPGAFLVNTARGSVVHEADLAAALRDGRLGGAGIDVFDPEPPGPDCPLLELDNVVLSPHFAAGPSDTLALKIAFCMRNLERFFTEGALEEEVSP